MIRRFMEWMDATEWVGLALLGFAAAATALWVADWRRRRDWRRRP